MVVVDISNKIGDDDSTNDEINGVEKDKSVKNNNWLKAAKSKILIKSKNQDFFSRSKNIGL